MEIPAQFINESVKTFQHQDSLPPLPQPDLDNTLDKYLDSVRAVASDEEYRQTEFVVQTFRTGLGRRLQNKFIQKTTNQRNWLERMWEEKAYLEGRYPSAPLVNITGPGPYYHTVFPPKTGTQLFRAGMVLHATVLFWDLIRKEKLQVDPAGNGALSCMNQYRRLFNSCKRPGLKQDSLNFFFKTVAEGDCPSHVVVICRGRFFKLDVQHPDGDLLTAPELEAQLRTIQERCDRCPAGPGVGALTGDQRTKWAENRDHLLRIHPDNASHVELIETAIICFVLDDREPADEHELVHEGISGDSTCRWFDKGVCQVVFKNGTVCSNCDHAPFDGIVYIFATYFGDLCLLNSGGKWKGSKKIRPIPLPRELVIHVDEKLRTAISAATTSFNALGDNIQTYNPAYKGYGKKLMRRYKLHPDTYVQLALQLAYYRMYRKPAPTYETGTVRRFWHGRTETVRSCTPEAIRWAKAMINPKAKSASKLALFAAAMKKHLKNMQDATFLKGCDRHLLALSVIAEEEGLPKPTIFTDPSFTKSGGGGNFVLSTSFVGYTPVIGGCAPMCEHGYGVFYSIQPEQVSFFMTTWVSDKDTDTRQFFASLAMSLNDMRQLLEEADPKMHKL